MSVDRISLSAPGPVLAALTTINERHPATEEFTPYMVIREATGELEVTVRDGFRVNEHTTYFVSLVSGDVSIESPLTGLFISLEDFDRPSGHTRCVTHPEEQVREPIVLGRPWHKGFSA